MVGELPDLATPLGLLMIAGLELPSDSTNLVNLTTSSRVRVVPGGPLVIFQLFGDHRPVELSLTRGPSQPRTREELVQVTVGRKTGQS
jgi:hypothetical protein